MTIRVGVGGIVHETNSYADDSFGRTPLKSFHRVGGDRLHAANEGARTGIGGILAGCESIGAQAVPLVWFAAQPSGTIERSAYEAMKRELLDAITAAMAEPVPLNALSLDLHGAGVVEGIDDLEGDLGVAIRSIVGDMFPVVATLDLHANISSVMADVFDVLIGYRLYPHTDMWETGYEATRLLPQLLDGTLRPRTYVEHLPMLLPTSTTDPGHPAAVMNELSEDVEKWPGVVDCSVFHGFPYTDVPDVGVHVVVTTNDDATLARRSATHVADWIWSHREQFRFEHPGAEQAVRLAGDAAQSGERPVVINETSDNCGAGTPGDGTHLLRAMIDAQLANAAFGFMFDPEVADQAHGAGVGATIRVRLGGKHDALHGEPIVADAYVKVLSDGQFVLRAMSAGSRTDLGRMARVVIGGIDVIVGSRRSQTFDTELFLLHGIDVRRYDIVALKSSQHFRAGFRDVAARIITADTPGLSTSRIDTFARRHSGRAMWPLDPAAAWDAGAR